jgi:hypothetical protein
MDDNNGDGNVPLSYEQFKAKMNKEMGSSDHLVGLIDQLKTLSNRPSNLQMFAKKADLESLSEELALLQAKCSHHERIILEHHAKLFKHDYNLRTQSEQIERIERDTEVASESITKQTQTNTNNINSNYQIWRSGCTPLRSSANTP